MKQKKPYTPPLLEVDRLAIELGYAGSSLDTEQFGATDWDATDPGLNQERFSETLWNTDNFGSHLEEMRMEEW